MPSNPQKDYQRCYNKIDKMLNSIPPTGIHSQEIIRQCLLLFPVTESSVLNFLKKYEELGYISIKENIIRGVVNEN